MSATDFRAISYPVRVYSGKDALENLPAEVKRRGAQRAFIVCGRTVSRRTGLIERVRSILGDSCAGVFDEIGKDSPLPSVLAATAAARAAGADMIVAVGGGSVIQAARVVAILLAEKGAPHDLITRYPEHGPAISPKLNAPKLPIINVLTTPNSAQNRGGSAVRDPNLDHRMEFFDPKTRPAAIFWDADALMTASPQLARSTGSSVHWRSIMNLGWTEVNPLLEGDRLHAYRLSARALPRVMDESDATPRIELCAAAFLHNRDADQGGAIVGRHWTMRVIYAFAAALFNNFTHIGQGEANTALTSTVMRRLGARDPEATARIAQALGAWREGMPLADAPARAADHLEALFAGIGMPTRLRELDFPRAGLATVLEQSLRNFNADPKREFVRERALLADVLEAAW